jgi:hypothetical protein
MDDITSGALVSDPETRRALQLDALSAILPMERRDRLAELLTDDDVATLKHLAREGMGQNTLRALASDLAYLDEVERPAHTDSVVKSWCWTEIIKKGSYDAGSCHRRPGLGQASISGSWC